MDIGFEGNFICHKNSINEKIHPDWIVAQKGDWVKVAPTAFETVFANDIRPDAKAAWVSYFSKRKTCCICGRRLLAWEQLASSRI